MASKKKSTQSTSNAFISAASEFSSFLDSLAISSDSRHEEITTLDEYKEVITSYLDRIKQGQLDIPDGFTKTRIKQFFSKKAQGDTGDGINMLGGIIMANLCRDRLREMADDKQSPYKELAQERVSDFFNKEFVERFAEELPFRSDTNTGILRRGNQAKTKKGTTEEEEEENDEEYEKAVQKIMSEQRQLTRDQAEKLVKKSTGSYTKFLNDLFSVTQKKFKWRDEILAPVSNDLQCLRAMGLTASAESVVELHNSGSLNCYICGCKIWRIFNIIYLNSISCSWCWSNNNIKIIVISIIFRCAL